MCTEVPPVPRNRALGKVYFPCDPCYGVDLTASNKEIACLMGKRTGCIVIISDKRHR